MLIIPDLSMKDNVSPIDMKKNVMLILHAQQWIIQKCQNVSGIGK